MKMISKGFATGYTDGPDRQLDKGMQQSRHAGFPALCAATQTTSLQFAA
jgi:hypothetical protein